MVAGIATLGLSVRPTMTKADLIFALKESAVDLNSPGWDSVFGWGRVNAYAAVSTLESMIFIDGFETGDTAAWD